MRKISYDLPGYSVPDYPFDELELLKNLLKSPRLINPNDIDGEIQELLYDYIGYCGYPNMGPDGEDVEHIDIDNYDSFYNNIKFIAKANNIDEFQTNVDLIIDSIKYNL